MLEYDYAFGEGGRALAGKYFGVVTSSGRPDDSAQRDQGERFVVHDYLLPLEPMAGLCRMKYIPSFVIHDSRRLDEENSICRHVTNVFSWIYCNWSPSITASGKVR